MSKTVKQYQTHQVLTNKNSDTKMNLQFQKIETPQPRTIESKHQEKNEK